MVKKIRYIIALSLLFSIKAVKSIVGYPANSCRFTPTCSQYAFDAFCTFPLPVACLLSIKRFLSCNPFFVFSRNIQKGKRVFSNE